MKTYTLGITATAFLAMSLNVAAEGDPASYCKRAAKLFEEDDIPGAVEEAKWCLESLEQLQQARQSDRFPQDVAGWKRGEIEQNKMMGFSNISTEYSKGEQMIEASYTSGGGGMGAMFSQMGLAGGGKKVRLGRYTGMVMEEGDRNEIMISLKMTPGMINLTSSSASLDELTAFAKAFPISDIDQ